MNGWRMDMTVLTDLSASMFVACFMILLIFLGLAQMQDERRNPEEPVEAASAFGLTARAPLSSAAMVDHLFARRQAGDGVSIDLFADRVDVALPGRSPSSVPADSLDGELAPWLDGTAPDGGIRLYVFSHETYHAVAEVLGRSGRRWTEMSVPLALREPLAPEMGWNPAFLSLAATAATPQAFRQGLAAILDAGPAERRDGARGGAENPVRETPGLLARLGRWLDLLGHSLALIFAAGALLVAERGRLWAVKG